MNYNRADLLVVVRPSMCSHAARRCAAALDRLLIESAAARAAVQAWEQRLALLANGYRRTAAGTRLKPPRPVSDQQQHRPPKHAERNAPGGPACGSRAWFAFGAALTFALVQLMPGAFVSLDGLAQREQALPQSYVGLLSDREGLPTLLISSTRHGTRVTVKSLRPIAVPAGKVAQVWALPKEGAAFPIGVATPTKPPGSTTFEMSATSEKLLSSVTRLAVSFEDAPARAGVSPREFVLIGPCVKLW